MRPNLTPMCFVFLVRLPNTGDGPRRADASRCQRDEGLLALHRNRSTRSRDPGFWRRSEHFAAPGFVPLSGHNDSPHSKPWSKTSGGDSPG